VDIVIPAVSTLEKDGTLVNLEGRLQRLTLGAAAPDDVKPELAWLAGLARRLSVPIPGWSAGAYRAMAVRSAALPAATHGDIPAEGILGVGGGPVPRPRVTAPVTVRDGELSLYVAPNLYDADDVANTERMAFLREATPVVLNREDARARGLQRGDDVQLTVDGSTFKARVDTSSRIQEGHARVPSGAPGVPHSAGTYHACMLARQTSVSLESGRAGS
jgi:NADH-quinone oxidoreductase subunit G